MVFAQVPDRVAITPEQEAEILGLYDRCLYRQAWEKAVAIAPLWRWKGHAQVLAGRVANNVFAHQLGRALHMRAWRENRASAEAAYFRALEVLGARGPYAAWKFLQKLPDFAEARAFDRANLLTAKAAVLTAFRDFERATAALDEADQMAGAEHRWLWVERADLLKAQDRYPEALEAADRSLALHPWYRPAVLVRAHLLQLLSRDEEAAAFLTEAMVHIESGTVASSLAVLQSELGRHEEALETLEKMREFSPGLELAGEQWRQGRISDAAYALGDLERAATAAREVKIPFFERIAERLAQAWERTPKAVRLPVPFVRQHHLTCAPATISAVSQFLGAPIDHLSLAEVVCYDGTPPHLERHWLQERGWLVREFRVTWPVLMELLDRALPLTLTTVETQSAHLQAVVGYDERRGTLFIRDPYDRTHTEAVADTFLERYASSGPRGSVFVRAEDANRLEGLELPEAEYYDLLYAMERALHEHRRPDAEQAVKELEASAPGHRLTWEAQRRLAAYDGNQIRMLTATEGLLALFPKDANLQLARLNLLAAQKDQQQYRAAIHEAATAEDTQPIFWRVWAEELMRDARQHTAAHRLLLRCLHFQPTDADVLSALGRLYWVEMERARATELHRLAACVQEKREEYGHAYLLAARHLRAAEAPLALYRERFRRFGGKSDQPARLLFWALTVLNRLPEAFEVLEEALQRRPGDGDLLLFAADGFARYGQNERAEALLLEAKDRSRPATWWRTQARLADYRCDLRTSLEAWERILAEEPLAMDAWSTSVRLTAELEGSAAAREKLRVACAQFPHYGPLWELAVEWTKSEGAAATEPLVRELLCREPDNAWAERELALILSEQRRFEEARAAVARAQELEVNGTVNFATAALVAIRENRLEEAREAAKAALRITIDYTIPLNQLMTASETFAEKRASIAFIREELLRQVVMGEGLLSFRELAYPILEREELLGELREAHRLRPDLWHAWVALTIQLRDMELLDEALEIARHAVEKFPLQAHVWLHLATVHGARREPEEEIRPLERALILAPAWGYVSRRLQQVYQRLDRLVEAERTLERARAAAPLDAENWVELAALHWKTGRKKEAQQEVEHALRLDPRNEAGWDLIREWNPSAEGRAVELARELTKTRPGEPHSWFVLAQTLPEQALDEALAALARATELDPHFADAYDVRAVLLAQAGRFDEAIQACAPPAWPAAEQPRSLAGRAAWIEAMRGNVQAAIARMKHLVELSPDYFWGWNRLAEWYTQLNRLNEARDAARQMARLAPNSALPLGYIADLQLRLDDEKGGLETLRRALHVNPEYEFAALKIFGRDLRLRDWPAAQKMLAHLRLHMPGPLADSCEVRLRCAQQNGLEALPIFRKLCFAPEEATRALDEAAEALEKAGFSAQVVRICGECLHSAGVNAAVGKWWVHRSLLQGDFKRGKEMLSLDPLTPVGENVYLAYIESATQHRRFKLLQKLVRSRGPALRARPVLWGTMGYALLTLEKWELCTRWLSDWPKQREAKPWMLMNLSMALQYLRRGAEAAAVSQRALELPRDHATFQHQLWVAHHEAMRGNLERASFLLQETAGVEKSSLYQTLEAATRTIVEVTQAPKPQRARLFQQGRQRIADVTRSTGTLLKKVVAPAVRETYRHCARLSGVMYNPLWRVAAGGQAPAPAPSSSTIGGARLIWIAFVVGGAIIRGITSVQQPAPVPPPPPAREKVVPHPRTSVPAADRREWTVPTRQEPLLDPEQEATLREGRAIRPKASPSTPRATPRATAQPAFQLEPPHATPAFQFLGPGLPEKR